MTRQSFPEIPFEALKSHAQPERVERVWRRLELDLAGAPRGFRLAQLLLPVGAAAVFALGVLVGVKLQSPVVEIAARPEPARLPTAPAGAPREPEAPQAQPEERTPEKHPRAHRGVPVADAGSEFLPETYGEPSGLVASEPAPVVVAESAEWEKLAEAGDTRAAKEAIERSGGFQQAVSRASAGQLLVLADIARGTGNREQAAQALRRVLAAYVSAPEAPVAAWTLGNLLEQAGDRAGADVAYATYRRLSPTGDFAEDAAARQVDVALSQGNLELGSRQLDEYAQNFPKGRHLAELRKRLAELSAPPSSAPATPTDTDDDDDSAEPSTDAPASPPEAPAPAREH
jgi:hypothetical protein